ncbi:MAG: nickel pincer cofactor biosynthesis protein LarC [Ignavibacteriales bacterium]|nr:nickel pincer cofactor biosynthesis protein LarC [Ignavibacteriales bacterium]
MKIAYFDTIAGISGDMTLGAFVSAGVPFDALCHELKKLDLPGYELSARHVTRSGIVATKIDVTVSEQPRYHRHLKDINQLIENSRLSDTVQATAKKIFFEVAVAEAAVHHSTLEKIHFHEVGAIDSLVDIVGTAICLEMLGVEKIFTSPVRLGNGGFVNTQHGTMPIPTPATVEILKGYPTVLTEIPYELTTPTGAAIIKALSEGVLSLERLTIHAIGYGSGTRDIQETPNLLRIFVGELDPGYGSDELVTIETNIDDMNPEILPHVVEKLLAAGAQDAYLVPVIMKKGRPGFLFSTLVERSRVDGILAVLFRETTTLGVRMHAVERRKLARGQKQVLSSLGTVMVKAVVNDGRERLVPEFEECKRLATEKNLPLIEVYRILEKELGS